MTDEAQKDLILLGWRSLEAALRNSLHLVCNDEEASRVMALVSSLSVPGITPSTRDEAQEAKQSAVSEKLAEFYQRHRFQVPVSPPIPYIPPEHPAPEDDL